MSEIPGDSSNRGFELSEIPGDSSNRGVEMSEIPGGSRYRDFAVSTAAIRMATVVIPVLANTLLFLSYPR